MNTQKKLVHHLVTSGALNSEHIITAFEQIDRRDFVCEAYDGDIYGDYPLLIGNDQTISQPSTVAFMMELLQPQVGENILDVGTGSGWTTAILASIVGGGGNVCGVEIVPELVQFGLRNLEKYNFAHASIELAGEIYGLPEFAPYDRILVSAAGEDIPEELITQLEIGGTMVMPVRDEIIRYTKKADGKDEIEHFYGFSFVPLIDPH